MVDGRISYNRGMTDIIKPRLVEAGSVVGVIAPSDAVEKSELEASLEIIKKWGLRVKMGKHVYSRVGDFAAGTPEERMEDLKDMIYDPEVAIIWSAGGGYAATEVLPVLNRETMKYLQQNPKWFIGYSDVCMILNALTSYRIANLMGPTLWGLSEWDEESAETLRKIVFGEVVDGVSSSAKWTPSISGVGEGRIVVADLETLIFSFGTRFDPLMYGSGPILLGIEELDIEKSTLQRQIDVILAHKRANRIAGIFIGRLVNIRELSYPDWGKDLSARDIITARVKKWGGQRIPLAFCDDFGHAEWDYEELSMDEKMKANHRFLAIPNGIRARLVVENDRAEICYLETVYN